MVEINKDDLRKLAAELLNCAKDSVSVKLVQGENLYASDNVLYFPVKVYRDLTAAVEPFDKAYQRRMLLPDGVSVMFDYGQETLTFEPTTYKTQRDCTGFFVKSSTVETLNTEVLLAYKFTRCK